jgi:Trypsin-like peptidase domain
MKLLILTLTGYFLFFKAYAQQSVDKVIIGDYDPNWVSVETVEDQEIREQSRAIGRLIMPAKKNSACTAFLISDDVIMTNEHCIGSANDAVGAKVLFDYLDESEHQTFICDQFISNNEKLDYALLKCQGSPGRIFGTVKLSPTELDNGSHIYIVHQNCDYYQTKGCKRSKKVSFGNLVGLNLHRVHHNADTLPGSSGSPIFSLDTHEVIGLHNSGSGHEETQGRRNGRGKLNLGIKMSQILAEIQTIFPDLP